MGIIIQESEQRFRLEYPLVVNDKDSSIMVLVPAGEFEMGDGQNILQGAINLHFLFPRQDAKIAKNTKILRPLRLCERFLKSAIYAPAEYSNCPKHQVYLYAYYIGVYAVTNRQYGQFVKETGHRAPAGSGAIWQNGRCPENKLDHPVVCVSWLG